LLNSDMMRASDVATVSCSFKECGTDFSLKIVLAYPQTEVGVTRCATIDAARYYCRSPA